MFEKNTDNNFEEMENLEDSVELEEKNDKNEINEKLFLEKKQLILIESSEVK